MDDPSQYRSVLDFLDDLFFTFDETGQFVEWNSAAVEVTGYSDAELATMSPVDFFEREDADRVAAAVAEVLETGDAAVEADLVTADGERIPYEFRATRLPDRDGSTTFAGIGRDVTERRRAERRRQAILDRMTGTFFAVDDEWRITYLNDQAVELLAATIGPECEREDLEGRNLWETLPAGVETTFHDRLRTAMETQEPVSFEEYYGPLDSWMSVQAYPSETGLSVYSRDVTAERHYREALEERERILRRMYDVVADGDLSFTGQVEALLELGREVLDTDYGSLSSIDGDEYTFEVVSGVDDSVEPGDVVPVSATYCELVASSTERLVLGDVDEDAPEETDRAGYTDWGIACYLGAPVYVDGDVYGTFCFYDTEARAEGFSEWHVTLVELMARWVSYELERERTNERLRRQNAKLERFADIVAHDLRNPLEMAGGYLEQERKDRDSEYLREVDRAHDRMEALVEDLLVLARAGETIDEPRSVELGALFERCWADLAPDDATLRVETDRTVEADPDRLRQLLENLIRNAVEHGSTGSRPGAGDSVEHSSTGSRSKSSGDSVEHGSTGNRSGRSGDSVEHADPEVTVTVGALEGGFFVEDDGPGIPESDRDRVFEHGFSTATRGTGFGLTIVGEIAGAHGWDVAVTEGSEGGARFEFTGVAVE